MTDKKSPEADNGREAGAPDVHERVNLQTDDATSKTPKIEGSHTQETIDPAERLPDEPEEQNDLA